MMELRRLEAKKVGDVTHPRLLSPSTGWFTRFTRFPAANPDMSASASESWCE